MLLTRLFSSWLIAVLAALFAFSNGAWAGGSSSGSGLNGWSGTGIGLSDAAPDQPSVRQIFPLDSNWKFTVGDPRDAEQPHLDDSNWTSVVLPHTWNAADGQTGTKYYRGPAWYRIHIHPPAGKSVFLRFDAASSTADVYVDGKIAGSHKGCFAAFCFPVSQLLSPASDHVVAVRVDNTARDDVPPLSADFTIFGGLYRRAYVLALNPVCISPTVSASCGVLLHQENVSTDSATVNVETFVRNDAVRERSVAERIELFDDRGNRISSTAVPAVSIPASSDGTSMVAKLHIDHPHLWNAKDDPYLYHVRVSLLNDQTLVDQVEQQLGLRFFRVDPDHGFVLNGASYPLHGVSRHQDRVGMGWAITPLEHQEDFDLIKEMGCTAVRLAHYQQAQDFYDLCDRGGMVVWAESCLVDAVTPSAAFDATVTDQLRELILQNFNHPSICFWSVCNELGNKYHGSKEQRDEQLAQQLKLVKTLNDLAHSLDPTRLTTSATDRVDPLHPLNLVTDLIADNRYDGWYRGMPSDWTNDLDQWHAALDHRPLGISEYGAGASVHQHQANPPKPIPHSNWHPEEWQTQVHEAAWDAMRQRPWLWCCFVWNMFDFASSGRHEGDQPGINDKGLITYDRKTRKDAFYFYKANWSDPPFVYIADRRFTPRAQIQEPVRVYSNCESVTLVVNGTSLGSASPDPDHIFRWPTVSFRSGQNELRVSGERNGKIYEDGCSIVCKPDAPTTQTTALTTQ